MGEPSEVFETVLLVAVDMGERDFSEMVEEFILLTKGAGSRIVDTVTVKRQTIDAATLIGKGKVDEIAFEVQALSVELVIFNRPLTPIQQRNLERALKTRVIDRTALILDIFSQRARSYEGKLQVDLARLQHLSTRLVRGWTHLERQRGGIGLRGGPGETQLETDRRLLSERVKRLKDKLKSVQKQRQTQRQARQKSGVFSISIVGYTNAGKSTLFNALASAKVYAADRLFATLDTTSRRLYLPEVGQVVISDTVGFIRDLPHELVAAFRATLEETVLADLLLHVVDASSPQVEDHIFQVNAVLKEIGADPVPQIIVMNKIDRSHEKPRVVQDYGRISKVWLSAATGEGLSLLRHAIADYVLTERSRPSVHASQPRESGTSEEADANA